jgi:dipeptidyl aminopeptidase/acylaminoacyl peptidase
MHQRLQRGAGLTAAALTVAATIALAACSVGGTGSPSLDQPSSSEPSAAQSSEPTSSVEAGARTLRTIADASDQGSPLTVGSELAANDVYTTHAATYVSDGLTISAVLHEPVAPGPHPGVVLVHGFINFEGYTSGGVLQREQDYLARAGYVVLYTDLRGLAGSDPAPSGPPDLEMGATADVINAVHALAMSGLRGLDGDRIALLGHSLGGLLVINVLAAKPGLVDAVVAFAPSSTDRWRDVRQYLGPGDPIYDAAVAAHGTPDTNPQYWADVSADTFVGQVTEPLLVVHGDADSIVPYQWSVELAARWQQAGKDVQLVTLKGEDHLFGARWSEAMDAVTAFFANHLS